MFPFYDKKSHVFDEIYSMLLLYVLLSTWHSEFIFTSSFPLRIIPPPFSCFVLKGGYPHKMFFSCKDRMVALICPKFCPCLSPKYNLYLVLDLMSRLSVYMGGVSLTCIVCNDYGNNGMKQKCQLFSNDQ